MPRNAAEVESQMHKMEKIDFPDCPCSTGVTHITMDRYHNLLGQIHNGPKSHLHSRTYNLSVNHCHYIIYTTSSHPFKWTDMTL